MILCSCPVVPLLSFSQDQYSVDEGDGQVTVCVILSDLLEPTESNITATLSTSPFSAAGKNLENTVEPLI